MEFDKNMASHKKHNIRKLIIQLFKKYNKFYNDNKIK